MTPEQRYIQLVGNPAAKVTLVDDVHEIAAIVKPQLRAAEFHACRMTELISGGEIEILVRSVIALVAAAHDEIEGLEGRAAGRCAD